MSVKTSLLKIFLLLFFLVFPLALGNGLAISGVTLKFRLGRPNGVLTVEQVGRGSDSFVSSRSLQPVGQD